MGQENEHPSTSLPTVLIAAPPPPPTPERKLCKSSCGLVSNGTAVWSSMRPVDQEFRSGARSANEQGQKKRSAPYGHKERPPP